MIQKMKFQAFLLLFYFWYASLLRSQCANSAVSQTPQKYIVDLDLPAEKRWEHVILEHKEIISYVHSILISYVPEKLLPMVEQIGADLDDYVKAPYANEMRGIANTLNVSLGDVVLANLIYDITSFCTSIVSQDTFGQIWHSRNLDYSFVGMLRNITIVVDFQKGGETQYSAVTFAGYVGIMSGQRPMAFTITVDERDQGNFLWNLIVAILDYKAVPVSFLVRDALSYDNTFSRAIERLAYTPTVADVYYIIAGVNPGEGAVITKGRVAADDIWRLDLNVSRWFLVETNYDHWTTPPPGDDRRDPAIKAMKAMGQSHISVQHLFNVMSTVPVLNNGTVYTVIMSAAKPLTMQTWIRT